ncbi:unnamed protein product [Gadus morhua 'NCC']
MRRSARGRAPDWGPHGTLFSPPVYTARGARTGARLADRQCGSTPGPPSPAALTAQPTLSGPLKNPRHGEEGWKEIREEGRKGLREEGCEGGEPWPEPTKPLVFVSWKVAGSLGITKFPTALPSPPLLALGISDMRHTRPPATPPSSILGVHYC